MKAIKPTKCDSRVLAEPIAPCEILDGRGIAGAIQINNTVYAVEILGYLPDVGEPVIDGYRLTKDNGESHDICLVRGRMECTCGDYEFRRAAQRSAELCDCKHTAACRRHFLAPADQYQPAEGATSDIDYSVEFDDP